MAAKPMGHAAKESWALGCRCSSWWPLVMVFVPDVAPAGGAPCLSLIRHHQMSHVHLSHQDLDLPPKPPLQLVPSAPGTLDWAAQRAQQRWWHPKKHGKVGGTLAQGRGGGTPKHRWQEEGDDFFLFSADGTWC